nr:MAG TPA: hypothetical protein [Caudoviricetes sp.]
MSLSTQVNTPIRVISPRSKRWCWRSGRSHTTR